SGKVFIKDWRLDQAPDPAKNRPTVLDAVQSQDRSGSRRRMLQSQQKLEQGGFACTIPAQNAVEASLFHRQAAIVNHLFSSEAFGEVPGGNGRLFHRRSFHRYQEYVFLQKCAADFSAVFMTPYTFFWYVYG